MRTFHVQRLFQVTFESYSIYFTGNNNTLIVLAPPNSSRDECTFEINWEKIRVLLRTKKHKQTKRNKNLLHLWKNTNKQIKDKSFWFFCYQISCYKKKRSTTVIFLPSPNERLSAITTAFTYRFHNITHNVVFYLICVLSGKYEKQAIFFHWLFLSSFLIRLRFVDWQKKLSQGFMVQLLLHSPVIVGLRKTKMMEQLWEN